MATMNPVQEIIEQSEAKNIKLEETNDNNEPEAKKPKLEKTDDNNELEVKKPKLEKADASELLKFEREIIEQIEYYFGDSNLFRDKFLQTEISKNDGWIPLSTLTTFKRLAALSTDLKVICDALDKSDSGLLEISEDRLSIRRHPERPLPERNEDTRKEISSRTAYVKGFPHEMEMPDFIEFFKSFPKAVHINIRKYLDKPTKTYKSKGSVFVTFNDREQCSAFLSQDIKYKETALITKWQTDYYAGKKAERQEKQKEKNIKMEPTIELPKGTVLFITDIKSEISRETIKETIESMDAEVAFVDFQKGNEKAYVRLNHEDSAKKFAANLENSKIKFGDVEATVSVLEGDEETKYLNECIEKMKLRRSNNNRSKHNNRKHKSND